MFFHPCGNTVHFLQGQLNFHDADILPLLKNSTRSPVRIQHLRTFHISPIVRRHWFAIFIKDLTTTSDLIFDWPFEHEGIAKK
jgi:hypothetical protein